MNDISLHDRVSGCQGLPQQEAYAVTAGGGSGGNDTTDPDDFPPTPPAVGLACTRPRRDTRFVPGYSVCAVRIIPDPDYPLGTNDPDYYEDGQVLRFYPAPAEKDEVEALGDAKQVCELYSHLPHELPPLGVRPTHLVVNDHQGRELFRRPFMTAA